MGKYAEIAVSNTSYSFDMPFTYSVPPEMTDSAERGRRVIIPFGRGNRKRQGIILNVLDEYRENSPVKPLLSITDSEPVLNDEMMNLVYWMKEHTFCTYFDAVRTFLPAGMSIKIQEKYKLAEDFPELPLSKEEENILSFLKNAASRREFDSIVEDGNDAEKKNAVESLIRKGFIISIDEARQFVNDSYIKMVRLSDDYIMQRRIFKLSPKQKKAALLLEENGSASIKEICYICSITAGVVRNLIKSGAAEEYQYEAFRISEKLQTENLDDIQMTVKQQEVYDAVSVQMDTKKPSCFLLHGVTGSGKTLIFEKLIRKTVNQGRQALMLIPEIALTPQIVESFRRYFGERIAVIHSGLSLSQRMSEYKRIKNNMADIVIGTRSAVFAPLDNIGIIIMDEEGDRSYKSDASPRYNTADVAKVRCKNHNAVLLMASATPSVESYYYARMGYYKLLTLNERYNSNPLPEVIIADMESERLNGNVSELSDVLVDEIYKNLNNHEQTILLLNRRGYHTVVRCFDCKKTVECPNCNIPLTYHKANNAMMCHYCGYSAKDITRCPSCESNRLVKIGYGTQKLEEEITRLFPDASVLRMDADTNVSRYAYENNFSDFRNGKYDIMLGTQLIGKGLDFPNVTLVGVIGIDKSLNMQDFRGGEQSFSLITQVIGRGGRGSKQGRAVLQTSMPDNYVIEFAAQQDYEGFYNDEIEIRKALIFPPVCDMCVLGFSSAFEDKADAASKAMIEIMSEKVKRENIRFPLRTLGPVKCTYGRINGKYRYRIILKCRNSPDFRKFISESLIMAGKDRRFSNVTVFADINGDTAI
ncbi:MAG: primosomal protein N' [Oscillospiraceae bacterium]